MSIRFIPLLVLWSTIAFSIWNCSQSQPDRVAQLQAEIEMLEAQMAQSPSPQKADSLAAKCQALAPLLASDRKAMLETWHKAAEALYYAKRYRSAADLLKQLLHDYPDAPNALQNALLLATIYQQLNDTLQQLALEQCIGIAFKGNPPADSLKAHTQKHLSVPQQLAQLGKELYDIESQQIDYKKVAAFIEISELYAALLPQDSLSPVLLLRAAEAARLVKQFDKAHVLYEWIVNRYPDHPKTADAVFMIAFTWDNDMGQYDSARVWYERFLHTYPTHGFADDAQILLQNLGKSPEELIKTLEQ